MITINNNIKSSKGQLKTKNSKLYNSKLYIINLWYKIIFKLRGAKYNYLMYKLYTPLFSTVELPADGTKSHSHFKNLAKENMPSLAEEVLVGYWNTRSWSLVGEKHDVKVLVLRRAVNEFNQTWSIYSDSESGLPCSVKASLLPYNWSWFHNKIRNERDVISKKCIWHIACKKMSLERKINYFWDKLSMQDCKLIWSITTDKFIYIKFRTI